MLCLCYGLLSYVRVLPEKRGCDHQLCLLAQYFYSFVEGKERSVGSCCVPSSLAWTNKTRESLP